MNENALPNWKLDHTSFENRMLKALSLSGTEDCSLTASLFLDFAVDESIYGQLTLTGPSEFFEELGESRLQHIEAAAKQVLGVDTKIVFKTT